MPGIESNTKYECNRCGSIFDFADYTAIRDCAHCGDLNYSQIVVARVCDFCSVNDSEEWWAFPCADFEYDVQFDGFPKGGSKGEWEACQTCHALILADDRRALARRALEHDLQRNPEMEGHYNYLYAITRRMHEGFFKHRTGEPTREEDTDGN